MDIDEKKCCAIIITYPDNTFEQNILLITQQFPNVVVVDNSASDNVHSQLKTISEKYKIDLITNPENFGIGKH